ncbi:MaoC family dehydratase [Pseudomonas sp. PDM18]|uniref:MaoC family dehydratase n=2 Tax=Pseudomonadaceae TaxID=135621 RepID=A0A5R9AGK9_PSENT|nr:MULTISPECIES: MaoC family dehydratase [Pseudomonadaceae]MBD9679456.1 MaoC family dehydratase [Pseudomonas sp. PDM18]QEY71724.1 MaoC family dehydratase [Pseudomonas denitrificans (nom. rej.)]TLP77640.1 MaoC family dehydratase [Pseudomonas nitroreducens]
MKSYETIAELQGLVGQVVGTSDWLTIDQKRIDTFAEATGDSQWIHVDPERAAKGPFGTTIAHGFLTLSLLPPLMTDAFEIRNVKMGLNYGLNKVRFVQPVPVGSRLRGHFKVLAWEPLEGNGAQITYEMTVEVEGASKPACVAETILRVFA